MLSVTVIRVQSIKVININIATNVEDCVLGLCVGTQCAELLKRLRAGLRVTNSCRPKEPEPTGWRSRSPIGKHCAGPCNVFPIERFSAHRSGAGVQSLPQVVTTDFKTFTVAAGDAYFLPNYAGNLLRVCTGKQINKKHFQNNSNDIDL